MFQNPLTLFISLTLIISATSVITYDSRTCTYNSYSDIAFSYIAQTPYDTYLLLTQSTTSGDVIGRLYSNKGVLIRTKTFYTFSDIGQASFTAVAMPDGSFHICYKESSSKYAYLEKRDDKMDFVSGPVQASTYVEDACYDSVLADDKTVVHFFMNS